jgi:hypothetical protein
MSVKRYNGTSWDVYAGAGLQGTTGTQGTLGTQGTQGTQGSQGTQGTAGVAPSDATIISYSFLGMGA